MLALKGDKFVGKPPMPMSIWIAQRILNLKTDLQFFPFFQPDTVLVPTPKSSLMRPHTLWVPERISKALVDVGLGKEVVPCLVRTKPVPKSAYSTPGGRPFPADHYDSMRVQRGLSEPGEILLIDDIVTRGSTLLGAANRLMDAFPETTIRAFAAMRTVSNPAEFREVIDPRVGTINLRASGDTIRRP